jgi:hypothetical protein
MRPVVVFSSAHCVLVSAAVLSVLLLARALAVAPYGFDFTDEGYYLMAMKSPEQFSSPPLLFGHFLHPIYSFFRGNITALRCANIALTFILSAGFFASLLQYLDREGHLERNLVALSAVALASSSMGAFHSWMITPNYNTVALHGCLIVFNCVLWFRDKKFFGRFCLSIGVGLGGWIAFMGKPTTAGSLAALVALFLICSEGRRSIAPMINSAITASALLLFSSIPISGSPFELFQALLKLTEQVRLLDPRYASGNLFRIDTFSLSMSERLCFLLAVLTGSWCILGARAPSKLGQWFASALATILLTLALASVLLIDGGPIQGQRYKVVLISAPLLASVLATVTASMWGLAKRGSRDHRWPPGTLLVFGVLALLPYGYALGTNRNLWLNMAYAGLFWVGAALALLAAPPAGLRHWKVALPGVVSVTVLMSAVLTCAAINYPYRQPGPLGWEVREISVPYTEGPLALNVIQADYVETARKASQLGGFKTGFSILDFTGRSPGLLYLLGAESLGQAWMIGGYPGSSALTKQVLGTLPCEELVDAWILTEPEGRRRISTEVTRSWGSDLEADFKEAARWGVPKDTGGQPKPAIQILLKPARNEAEAISACEEARILRS